MEKTRNITILHLILIFAYFLFSQFYLKTLGNFYTYLINPAFFIILALILKYTIVSPYKTKKYKKSIMFYIIITIFAYVVIYLISGLLSTYGKNPYANSFKGIILNLYSVGLVIVCKEYIRYKLINNVFKKDRKLIFTFIVIAFSMEDIVITTLINSSNIYYLFKTVFSIIIPSILRNCLFTYIDIYTDYMPAIVYQILYYLMLWIPPILPNSPWVFYSVLDILFPVVLLLYCIFEVSSRDKMHIYQMSKPIEPKGMIPITATVVIAIWFAIGIFPIKPIGVASGSMKPVINVGDLVLIKKCNANSIEINDIIEYKRENYSVIHRVIDKYDKGGEKFFITKGDNNDSSDGEPISEKNLKGKVIAKIPYIAYPTIWINALSGRQNVDIEMKN